MGNKDLLIAANTVWVVIAAILVMFMQAGFAFLEAGLTRMKNAAHIAGPLRNTTLQPLAPHSLSATSAARCAVDWFQLQPRLPVSLSHAIAP